MELKRTILAVVLSMAVLIAFQYWAGPKRHAQRPVRETAQSGPAAKPEAPPPVPATPAAEPPPPERAARRTVLENRDIRVELSNLGGTVVSAKLKEYRDRIGPGAAPVELLGAPSGLDRAAVTALLERGEAADAVYEELERGADGVVYRWRSPGGLEVVKTYRLPEEGYVLYVNVQVRNDSGVPVRERLGLRLVHDYSSEEKSRLSRYNFQGPAYYAGEYEEVKLKKVAKGVRVSGEISWAALVNGYFLVAAVPDEGAAADLRIGAFRDMERVVEVELGTPAFDLSPGQAVDFSYRIYTGPKLQEALAPLGSHLTEVVHYGFFNPVAKPLLWFLKAIYRVTGNYGVAIIVLTVLVKIVFWPLSARSFRSMQKMKELQPKLQRLKEKYGNDRERLNREVMQLYRTHRVNPLGGCLPIVVQIPVFFALYRVLLGSIELRHAPFMLWIQDLSAKDPYYITPVLMGVTMFLQQKLTPASGTSEGQMKMMLYGMPVVFTFLFLNFPSGLVLYWLVNNILSVLQQAMMLRQSKTAEAS